MGYDQGFDSISYRKVDSEGKGSAIPVEYNFIVSQGGTGRILEYFGPGVFNQSCTGEFGNLSKL